MDSEVIKQDVLNFIQKYKETIEPSNKARLLSRFLNKYYAVATFHSDDYVDRGLLPEVAFDMVESILSIL